MRGWDKPVDAVPPADQVLMACLHGGRGRPHDVETFYTDPVWMGYACGPLVEAASAGAPDRRPHLGGTLYQRTSNERRTRDRRSRLFHRVPGELPDWVGRCEACSRAPRDRQGRRTVRGEFRMPGDRLVTLLNGAAGGWLEQVDLFDLANHGGRGTVEAILAARLRVAESLSDEQPLG